MKAKKNILFLILSIWLTSCSFFSASVKPDDQNPSRKVSSYITTYRPDSINYNECSELLDTEDLSPQEYEARLRLKTECENARAQRPWKSSIEGVQYPYLSELGQTLTPAIEAGYDVFLLINTADVARENMLFNTVSVPKQHVRVVVKKNKGTNNPDDNFFIRDATGKITGIDQDKIDNNVPELAGLNEVPADIQARYKRHPEVSYLVPSTTGSANYMKTVNGLYLVNFERSASRRATSFEAPMSFQTYIDTQYRSGRESGIAIHGTPARNRHLLGVRRGSHGCARVHPAHARVISDYVRNLPHRMVPNLDWKSWMSFELQSWDESALVSSAPVMFVIYNGYDPQLYQLAQFKKSLEFKLDDKRTPASSDEF